MTTSTEGLECTWDYNGLKGEGRLTVEQHFSVVGYDSDGFEEYTPTYKSFSFTPKSPIPIKQRQINGVKFMASGFVFQGDLIATVWDANTGAAHEFVGTGELKKIK